MPLAAVPAATWITGATALGGAAIASRGADRQATAATDTANQNNALQRDIFNQQRADLAPWRASGTAALAEINRRLGLGGQTAAAPRVPNPLNGTGASGVAPTGYGANQYMDPRDTAMQPRNQMVDTMLQANSPEGGAPQMSAGQNVLSTDGSTGPQVLPGAQGPTLTGTAPAGTGTNALDPENRYGGFYASPGYQFRFDEGQRGINANRAASGSLQSGDAMRALTRYGQDYASNEFNTQLNQLFSVAGLGQTATGQGNALAGQYGSQVSQNNQNASNALQSSYGNQAAIWGNALQGVGGAGLDYFAGNTGIAGRGGQNPPVDTWGLF